MQCSELIWESVKNCPMYTAQFFTCSTIQRNTLYDRYFWPRLILKNSDFPTMSLFELWHVKKFYARAGTWPLQRVSSCPSCRWQKNSCDIQNNSKDQKCQFRGCVLDRSENTKSSDLLKIPRSSHIQVFISKELY